MARVPRWRVLTMAAIGAALLLVVSGCDWLQPGFSAGGDNANPYEAALTASTVGSLTQRYTLGSQIAPITANGTLFSVSSSGAVSAVRSSDGLPIWTTTLPGGAAFGIAADGSGRVFAIVPGTLYALDAATGAVRWSHPIAGLSGGPLFDGGKIFVTAGVLDSATSPPVFDDSVIAIDPTSGSALWTHTFQDNGNGGNLGAVAGSGYVAVNHRPALAPTNGSDPDAFSILNESDGSILNESDGTAITSGSGSGTVYKIVDGLILGQVLDNNGIPSTLAWDPRTNTNHPLPDLSASSSAASADLLITGRSQGDFAAFDPNTGATRWTASLPSGTILSGGPVIAGSLVYSVGDTQISSDPSCLFNLNACFSSKLYAFDAATGTQVAAVPVASGAGDPRGLVVSEGMVFIVTVNGTITAYAPTG